MNDRFKIGQKVYFIGQKTGVNAGLKDDLPYIVSGFYSVSDEPYIYIRGNGIGDSGIMMARKAKHFISEEEYKNKKTNKMNIAISDENLMKKIEDDTENNVLYWIKPYPDKKNFFRTYLNLDNPVDSSLRIDVVMITIQTREGYPVIGWRLTIYFHRKKFGIEPVTVREIKDSLKVSDVVKKIRIQLINREIEIQNEKDEEVDDEEKDIYEKNHQMKTFEQFDLDIEDFSEDDIFGKKKD